MDSDAAAEPTPPQVVGGADDGHGPWNALRFIVLGAWGLAIGVSFAPVGQQVAASALVHAPFVSGLTLIAAAVAVVAWRRHVQDESRQTLLLSAAFTMLAVLYAPHVLLDASAPDPTHLIFGPVSRLAFTVLLTAAVLARGAVRASTGRRRWALGGGVLVAAAVDVVIHTGAAGLWGDDPVPVIRGVETVSLLLSSVCLLTLLLVHRRLRLPLLRTLALAVGVMASGSMLFLSTTPWTGRWWTAHLALGVTGLILGAGLAEEAHRRGRVGAALGLDALPLVAEHVVHDLRDGLAVFDERARLVGWNRAARDVTGWSREAAERRLDAAGVDGLQELDDGRWVRAHHLDVRRYGRRYRVIVLSDARDHVARAQAVDELQRANHRLRDFVAVAAHELRTPVATLLGYSTVLAERPPADPAMAESIHRQLHESASRLRQLADDLLSTARLESGTETASVEDLHLDVQMAALTRMSPTVEVAIPAGVVVRCDPEHLRRIVVNLVANAERYGEGPIEVSAEQEGSRVVVRVRDHGLGVPAAEVPALFEPFTRGSPSRQTGGTGLGLAIVRDLCALNGGHARYRDATGGGACFEVDLPAGDPVQRARPDLSPVRGAAPVR